MNPKFSLFQKVYSKKLGPPTTGSVVGILTYNAFSLITNYRITPNWDKNYNDWPEKFVYIVEISNGEEVCPITKNEFPNYSDEIFKHIRKYSALYYPEDDLEIYND